MVRKKILKFCLIASASIAPVAAITPISLSILNQTASTIKNNSSLCEDITLYTTNDVHGRFLRDDSEDIAGYKAISGYLNVHQKDLLIDAGDLTQGTAINDLDYGKTAIDIVKTIGYDALGIGNHEFDFGFDKLKENVEYAKDLFLSANIKKKTSNEQIFSGSKIIKLDDYNLNIGLIGLTTPTTATQTKAESVKDVYFDEYVSTTKQEIQKLKQQDSSLNFIIIVAHSGLSYSKKLIEDSELAKEIDLIIDGHTHETYHEKINNTHIFQSGSYSQGLRKTVFDFNKETGLIETFRTDMIEPLILKQYENYADKNVKQLIDDAENKMNMIYGEVISEIPYKLNGERTNIRSKQTNLGDFLADSLYDGASKLVEQNTKIDLALLNSGGIRQSIEQGQVTKMDIYNCIPNQNLLSIVSVPGSILKQILSANKSIINGSTVFQVSSQVKITINSYNDITLQIYDDNTKTFVNIEDNKMYNVATIDYLTTSESGTYSLLNPTVTAGVKSVGTYENATVYVEQYMKSLTTEKQWQQYKTEFPNNRIIYNGQTVSADTIATSPYKLYVPINGGVYTEENGSNLLMDSYAYKAKQINSEVDAAILYNSTLRNYNSSKYPYIEGEISVSDIKNVVSRYALENSLTIIKMPGKALVQILENDLNKKKNNQSIVYHYSNDIKAFFNSDNTISCQIKNKQGAFENINETQLYTIATNNYNSLNDYNLAPEKWISSNQEWINSNPNSQPSIVSNHTEYNDLSMFVAIFSTFSQESDWIQYQNQYPNQRLVIS